MECEVLLLVVVVVVVVGLWWPSIFLFSFLPPSSSSCRHSQEWETKHPGMGYIGKTDREKRFPLEAGRIIDYQ